MNWPAPGTDPWYAANPTDGLAMRNYYAVNATPTFKLDGATVSGSQSAITAGLNNRRNVASPLWFDLNVIMNSRSDSVVAVVRVVSNTPITTGHALKLMLVEVHEHWNSPAPNGQTNFDFPMVKFAPSTAGQSFTSSGSISDTVTYIGKFPLRETGPQPYTLENCGVVAYVQNDGASSKEILQSAFSRLTLTNPSLSLSSFLSSEVTGNSDGRIDPGETGSVVVTIGNNGLFAQANNAQAKLRTTGTGITMIDSVVTFGLIQSGDSVMNDAHPFRFSVAANAPIQWANFQVVVTADTGYQTVLPLQIRIGRPDLLLVQSDTISDFSSYYTSAFTALGLNFDKWDADQQPLTQVELMRYSKCFWFTGQKQSEVLTASDRAALTAYINSGKNLVLSSQNALEWCLSADSTFALNYLRATLVQPTVGTYQLYSIPGDAYFDNLFIRTAGSGGASDADNQTVMLPTTRSNPMYRYNNRTDFGAVYYTEGASDVVFLGFPLEAVSGAANSTIRDSLIASTLRFFDHISATPEYNPSELPNRLQLSEAFPNPFNPTTVVNVSIPAHSNLRAEVVDLSGRVVSHIANGEVAAGTTKLTIDLSQHSSGIYFLRVEASGSIETRKLILMK